MIGDEPLASSVVLEPRSLISSAVLKSSSGSGDFVILARTRSLSIRKAEKVYEPIHEVPLPGRITGIKEITDQSAIIVTYRSRGVDYISTFSDPPHLRPRTSMPIALPPSLGTIRKSTVALSNECNGIIVAQTHETSMHIAVDVLGPTPRIEMRQVTRLSPIRPILAMALVPRGEGQYVIVTIVGESDTSSPELRIFDLSGSSLQLVTTLPPALAFIQKQVVPFRLHFDQSASSLLFLGGRDISKSSSFISVSVSDAFASLLPRSLDFFPCEPLQGAVISRGPFRDCVYIATAYGELYSINMKTNKMTLVDGRIPSARALTYIDSNQSLLVVSEFGDSILRACDGEKLVVHRNASPMRHISSCADYRVLTTVSGIGNSACVNRIKTSGVGVVVRDIDPVRPERAFVAGSVLVLTWKERSIGFRLAPGGGLSELIGVDFPPDLVGVYPMLDQGEMWICVSQSSVVMVNAKGSRKETWKTSSPIVTCAYCKESSVLVVTTCLEVYRLGKKETQKIFSSDPEISCITVSKSLVAIGDWSGRISLLGSSVCIPSFFPRIPRSVVITNGEDRLIIGFHDGSVYTVDLKSGLRTVEDGLKVGLLPAILYMDPDRSVVYIGGDRPGILQSDSTMEFVDRASGIVLFVREIAGICENWLWYTDKDGLLKCCFLDPNGKSECHIQRRFIDADTLEDLFPVSVEVFPSQGKVAVAVSSSTKDSIAFYDQFELRLLDRVDLADNMKIYCMSAGEGILAVGLKNGSILVVSSVTYEQISFSNCHDDVPVTAVSIVGSSDRYIVSTCGRTTVVSQLSAHRNVIEHCASIDHGSLGVCVSSYWCVTSGLIRIAVGDIQKSVSLLTYNPEEMSLSVTARDLVHAFTCSVELVSEDSLLLGDELGNVYYLRMVEPALGRLERLQGCNFGGSLISCIRRLDDGNCYISTFDGGVYIVSKGETMFAHRSAEEYIEPVFEPHRLSNPSTRGTFIII